MHIIFIVGPPAAGKTTLALSLAREYGYEYCSPSDWLRITRDRPSNLGQYVTSNYTFDCLDPLVSQWVSIRVREAIMLGNTLIVDGYPRTKFQTQQLSAICANQRFHVISLCNVRIEESVRRTLQRQWMPPHGSLMEADNKTDYHVITASDAEKRYRVYLSTCMAEPPDGAITIDASVTATLVQSQAKHWLETLPSLLVALPKEANTAMFLATPLEAAQVIQQTMILAGMRNPNQQRRFVGSHPVSLQRCHFSILDANNYLVSRKWDGERSLLLLYAGHVWMLMRNFVVWKSRWAAEIAADEWDDSLLDVEWLQNSGTLCIIDCVAVAGTHVGSATLFQRLNKCRHLTKVLPTICDVFKQATLQRYYAMADFRFVATTPVQADGDRCDGFVFTAADRPYHIGRDSNMFKFKAPEENTVDLMVFSGTELYARADDDDSRMIKVGTLAEVPETPSYPDGAVLECLLLNRAFKTWRVVRHRTDRSEGNANWVVGRILESLAENITLDELCNMSGVR